MVETSTPIGHRQGTDLFVQIENVSVLSAEPRRSIIRVPSTAFDTYGACVYALDIAHGQAAVKQWEACAKYIPRDASFMCTTDANPRLCNAQQPCVGDIVDPPSTSGADETHLIKFVQQFNLYVVNTHAET